MIEKLLFKLSGYLPARLIDIDGKPYLERYYLGTIAGVTFYLHRFVSKDSERHLHNHPWEWGRALVLSGGYLEERVRDLTVHTDTGCLIEKRFVNRWSVVNGNTFHRIAEPEAGTWTLFMHGPRTKLRTSGGASFWKGWGFLEKIDGGVLYVPAKNQHPTEWWVHAARGSKSNRQPLQGVPE